MTRYTYLIESADLLFRRSIGPDSQYQILALTLSYRILYL